MKARALVFALLFAPGCGDNFTTDADTDPASNPVADSPAGLDDSERAGAEVPPLAFLLGDQIAFTDEQFQNPAILNLPDDTGITISYSSSDPDIASVDASGGVTAHRPGRVTITATATAGSGYARIAAEGDDSGKLFAAGDMAQANYDVLVNVELHAWVGATDTELEFAPGVDGVELYRSTDADCNITDVGTCADGQSDALAADTLFLDTALTLDRPAYYTYVHGGVEKQQPMSIAGPNVSDPSVVEFQGRLWQIGGMRGVATSSVWSSVDGMNWIEEAEAAEFPARGFHSVVEFAGKLWVVAGSSGSSGYLSDVWSSEDGITWTQATAAAGFTPRTTRAVFAFQDKLWLLGGHDGEGRNDLWSTTDGITWTEVAPATAVPVDLAIKVLELGGTLYAITGGPAGNSIYTSTDGASWTELAADAGFPQRENFGAAAYDGRLWVVGGYTFPNWNDDIWYSDDGLTWSEADSGALQARERASVVPFNDTLLIIGGVNRYSVFQDAWISLDGMSWRSLSTSASFTARWFHRVLSFAGELWVLPGYDKSTISNDIWSSTDGLVWNARVTDAPFAARGLYGATVFDDKMWLIGGVDQTAKFFGDVWWSADGETWTEATAAAEFSARAYPMVAAFAGKLWLVGGLELGVPPHSDVWSSTDGVTWTQELVDAPFGGVIQGELVAYDGALYLVVNDQTWSSDNGTEWTLLGATPFSTAKRPTVFIHDGELWALAANGTSSAYSTVDGVTWTEHTLAADFGARDWPGGASFAGKLWLVGGNQPGGTDASDVWSSVDGDSWRRGHRTVVTF